MNPISALIDLIRTQQWMIAAFAALVLFVAIGLSSWRRIRRRIAYETWYFVHLTAYLAVVLAFGHQLTLGTDISGHTLSLTWWIGLSAATFAWVVAARSPAAPAHKSRPAHAARSRMHAFMHARLLLHSVRAPPQRPPPGHH